MKTNDFVLKIFVLVLLLIVFTAVVITSRWTDESYYANISCQDQDSFKTSSQDHSLRHQTGDFSMSTDSGMGKSEVTSSVTRTELSSHKLNEEQQQVNVTERRVNRLDEEPDEGAEPPDDSKSTYGNEDVE